MKKLLHSIILCLSVSLLSSCSGTFLQQPQSDNAHPVQILQDRGYSQQTISKSPQHIALLLPLTGAVAKQAQAIQNGFLAAYYQAKTSGYAPQVSVLDTSQDNVTNIYNQAVKQGADIIVGPLLKTDIEKLVSSERLSVPTIALNTVSNNPIKNLFQFGLDPDDEVQQVAEKMHNDHRNRVLVVLSNDSWGQRVNSVFQPYWSRLGGTIVTEVLYSSRAQLSDQLRNAMNLDASQRRYMALRSILRENIRFTPHRRQDFDAIFLVASPQMGRQILPLLHYYYANNVPTYSTSQIYSGYTNSGYDHDLDGVVFDDIPWLYSNTLTSPWMSALKQNIQSAWPSSSHLYPRFYAFGTDAFKLISKISQMSSSPGAGLNSATGQLFLQPNGKVYRKLIWVQMKNGHPVPISSY